MGASTLLPMANTIKLKIDCKAGIYNSLSAIRLNSPRGAKKSNMATRRRATRAPLYDCEDVLRLLNEENVECESSSSEDSIFDLSDPEAGYKG